MSQPKIHQTKKYVLDIHTTLWLASSIWSIYCGRASFWVYNHLNRFFLDRACMERRDQVLAVFVQDWGFISNLEHFVSWYFSMIHSMQWHYLVNICLEIDHAKCPSIETYLNISTSWIPCHVYLILDFIDPNPDFVFAKSYKEEMSTSKFASFLYY